MWFTLVQGPSLLTQATVNHGFTSALSSDVQNLSLILLISINVLLSPESLQLR
jgi:hypothetical protein